MPHYNFPSCQPEQGNIHLSAHNAESTASAGVGEGGGSSPTAPQRL